MQEKEMIKPTPVRIVFSKKGALQFVSHLDLMRTMTKLVVRANINVYYTEGFNPKPKLVFALPLSVGTESELELLDIKVHDQKPDLEEIKRRLILATVPDIEIKDVYIPETKFRDIAHSRYLITMHADAIKSDSAALVTEMLKSSVIVTKRTKAGEAECDIAPFIKSADVKSEDGEMQLDVTLAADPEHYLNPEYIVTAIMARIGYKENIAPGADWHSVMRVDVLGKDGKTFK